MVYQQRDLTANKLKIKANWLIRWRWLDWGKFGWSWLVIGCPDDKGSSCSAVIDVDVGNHDGLNSKSKSGSRKSVSWSKN